MWLGSQPFIVLSDKCISLVFVRFFFFFYEFFTPELNIIDIDVFDRDLCVGENERKMKSIRDRKMRQHA